MTEKKGALGIVGLAKRSVPTVTSGVLDGGHGAKCAFVVLSQKVARFDFENQLFEWIQV